MTERTDLASFSPQDGGEPLYHYDMGIGVTGRKTDAGSYLSSEGYLSNGGPRLDCASTKWMGKLYLFDLFHWFVFLQLLITHVLSSSLMCMWWYSFEYTTLLLPIRRTLSFPDWILMGWLLTLMTNSCENTLYQLTHTWWYTYTSQ